MFFLTMIELSNSSACELLHQHFSHFIKHLNLKHDIAEQAVFLLECLTVGFDF